jgi:Mg2+ and Co2+ transporter CorA
VAVRRIDLLAPSRDELLELVPASVDPGIVDMLTEPASGTTAARPLLEDHGAYVFCWLPSPVVDPDRNEVTYPALGIVATAETVLTVRFGGHLPPAPSLPADATAGVLLHKLLDSAAEAFVDLVDWLFGELDELEDGIECMEARMVLDRMRRLRHDIVHARRTAALIRAALRAVVEDRIDLAAGSLFPPEIERLFLGTAETLLRVTEELDVARDLLAALRDHHHAMIAEAQNDIVKKLTVIASLVLVPTLITGFYGQNFAGAFDDAYWRLSVSVALIAAATALQLAIFRWRRWL